MMAHSIDIRPEPFKGAVCRYALSRVIKDKRSPSASGRTRSVTMPRGRQVDG